MLMPWLDPTKAEIERSAVYTFHGLVADRWRSGRILLAGDAAHQTPPFIGQGMCAGMRDAANLAWKLAAVLEGRADEGLLDSYQAERDPHAWAVIGAAVGFGQWICTTDPAAAAARDEEMREMAATAGEAPDLMPLLTAGRAVGTGGGGLSPQPRIDGQLLDERSGRGICLLTRTPLDAVQASLIEQHGCVLPAEGPLADLLGEDEAVCLRPDRYLLAAGSLEAVLAAVATCFASA
jgi:3-(3-hydroxy-phenyl)propionate hydroxylase